MKKYTAWPNVLLLLVLLLALLCGCSLFQGDTASDPADSGGNSEEPGEESGERNGSETQPGGEAASPDETAADNDNGKEENRNIKIALYFGDKKAIENDQTCKTGYVSPVVREYPHTTAVLRLALQELIRGPLPGEDNAVQTLPHTVKIINLEIKDGVALIDFSPELSTDSTGGTLCGTILKQSLVYTATEFPAVKSVLVTVKGQPYSDGHFIWEYPVTREDFNFSG